MVATMVIDGSSPSSSVIRQVSFHPPCPRSSSFSLSRRFHVYYLPALMFKKLFSIQLHVRLLQKNIWTFFRYAEQQRLINEPPPYASTWTPVDVLTMKAWVGLCLLMGVMRLPSRHDYWRKTRQLLVTQFGTIMSRNRFDQIWRYLHLSNNETRDATDKLFKIRWFIDFLNSRYMEVYCPYGNFVVDESMIKFKGRLQFRHLPSKPIKWGIKVWALAESSTGYLSRCQIYRGKEGGRQENGLSHQVVMDLVRYLSGSHATIFMDNFYTSVKLLQDLLAIGPHGCGTVRANRKGLPTTLLPKNIKLRRHEFRTAQYDDITYSIWVDTKPVLTLSNYHSPDQMGFVTRRGASGQRERVPGPAVLESYQQNMKGVDLMDQMVGYYMLHHRSKKWWRRIFFYLLATSVHNSYVVAKDTYPEETQRQHPTFMTFLEDVAIGLIGDCKSNEEQRLHQRVQHPLVIHEVVAHLFDKNKVCRECSDQAQPGERSGVTTYGCRQCRVAVHPKCQTAHQRRHSGNQ